MEFSLIIPAYNEERRILSALKDYYPFLQRKYRKFEVIVVCDGNDNTAKVSRNFGKGRAEVKVMEFPRRLGKGGAVIRGMEAAQGRLIGFTDADDSTTAKEFGRIIDAIDGGGCAIGSRRMKGAKKLKSTSFGMRTASRIFNFIINALFNLRVWDTQCGAKVFGKDVIKKVLPKMVTKDFSFDVEMLWRVKQLTPIVEVPIEWTHVEEDSKSTILESPKMLISIMKARLRP